MGHPLNRAALEIEAPGISPSPAFTCGLLFPQEGQLDSRRQLMAALERAGRRGGVHLRRGSRWSGCGGRG